MTPRSQARRREVLHRLYWEGLFVRNLSTGCGQSALRFNVENVTWDDSKVTCRRCLKSKGDRT